MLAGVPQADGHDFAGKEGESQFAQRNAGRDFFPKAEDCAELRGASGERESGVRFCPRRIVSRW